MYITRIKKWDLHKNYRAKDKERLALEVVRTILEHRSPETIKFKGRPVKLDRIHRYCKASKSTRAKGISLAASSPSSAIHQVNMVRRHRQPKKQQHSAPSTATKLSVACSPSPTLQLKATPVPVLTTSDSSRTISHSASGTISPEPPILAVSTTANIEIVLLQTHAYFTSRSWKLVKNTNSYKCPQPPILTPQSSPSAQIDTQIYSKRFWFNVKSAIYYLKVRSPELAWPLLHKAGYLAIHVIEEDGPSMLESILSVISPINTRCCPDVRKSLLRYLSATIYRRLGQFHPLHIICEHSTFLLRLL